ncbi:acyl-CoA dehydrogenase family protein [Chloroflexota bacterium]
MNFALTEEQELIRDMSRGFFEREYPDEVLKGLWESEEGYSAKLWEQMAGLGWLGLGMPEKYGGSEGCCLDLVMLYEEMGRAAFLSPHLTTVVLCGHTILAAGSEEQKAEFLPNIAQGKAIWALALTEPSGGWDVGSVLTTAKPQKDGFVISGTKLFVNYAAVADYLVCVAKTSGSGSEDGITLFALPARSEGISYTPLKTMSRGGQCEVQFNDLMIGKESLLGPFNGGWAPLSKAMEMGAVVQCAEMIGGARRSLDMCVDHGKQRVQFDRLIGSFQAVQQRSADMAKDIEAASLLVYAAACKLDSGLPAAADVAMAKAFTNPACRRVLYGAHHTLAGAGFTLDHNLHFYTKRVSGGEYMLGDVRHHLDTVAQELGL